MWDVARAGSLGSWMTSGFVVRRGDKLDVPFLRSLLGFAYNWHVNAFDTDISISRYVDAWGRKGDTALIAMDGGHSVGAGWFRLFPDTLRGYGYVDEETPEMTIVVVPTRQDEGIGATTRDGAARTGQGGRLRGRVGLGRARGPRRGTVRGPRVRAVPRGGEDPHAPPGALTAAAIQGTSSATNAGSIAWSIGDSR